MKKLLILLALMFALGVQAQVNEIKFSGDNYLLQYYDLTTSSGDTSIIYHFRNNPEHSWSFNFGWEDVIGDGVISLEVTNFDELINWEPYVDNLSTIITGATGHGAWEDNMWSWKYFRIVITKGTISAGYLNLKSNTN